MTPDKASAKYRLNAKGLDKISDYEEKNKRNENRNI